jgi:hypothetical protein
MRLSLGLIIFGTLGIIIASYVGMDIVHKYETPELEDGMRECYEEEGVSTEDRQNCVYDLYSIYRYAAFFKDICIVLVLSGIFIEVRNHKGKPDEEA